MTIEDLLDAGITLQGFLSIIKFDDKTDQKIVIFHYLHIDMHTL